MDKIEDTSTTELHYEPGNGRRYHLLYTVLRNKRVLTWLKRGGSGGSVIVYGKDAFVGVGYIREKMEVTKFRDATALARWIDDRQASERITV
tara:strand:- start:589 stop:864 length:276 start_codon:yes stop_codon:yes gene_type:complete